MEDIELTCVCLILANATHLENKAIKKRIEKKSVWVKPWLSNRDSTGAFGNIFAELWLQDEEEFRRYLRMNTETYQVNYCIVFI